MTKIYIYKNSDKYQDVLNIVEYIKDRICEKNFVQELHFMDCPTYIGENNEFYCRELIFNDYKKNSSYNMKKTKKEIIQKIIKLIKEIKIELQELYDITFMFNVLSDLSL